MYNRSTHFKIQIFKEYSIHNINMSETQDSALKFHKLGAKYMALHDLLGNYEWVKDPME